MRGKHSMMIREAKYEDGRALQSIQSRCIAGNTLRIVTVNGPDFFARTSAYEDCKVFVIYEEDQIIGSVACAVLNTVIDGKSEKTGYIFQAFVAPEFRGRGIIRRLYEHCEQFLKSQGIRMAYGLILQDNLANRRAAKKAGYEAYEGPRIEYLFTYKKVPVDNPKKKVRTMTMADIDSVCDLFNGMWMDHDLYEPTTKKRLLSDMERIPGFGRENTLVVEENGKIVACASYWDWSEITKIMVKSWNTRIKITAIALDVARTFRDLPQLTRPGNILKQWCLINFAFSSMEDFEMLLKHLNNLAVDSGIDQLCFVASKEHPAVKELKGFVRLGFNTMLYAKRFDSGVNLGNSDLWISGVGL